MQPGALLADRFRIERLAGSGGMGVVYRAADLRSGEPVAVKVLGSTAAADAERFLRETRVLAELSHPAIVRYVSHGATEKGDPWLAMEWLDGEDLAARLARQGLTIVESLALAARVADAIAEAHSRGVVHRDIKPSNLFLPDRSLDRVKVLDFGLARIGGATKTQTRTGTMLGTPAYMAPEQALGERDVGPRADVFSMGCVLFECLAGRPPFMAETLMAMLAKILLQDAPPIGDCNPDVPSGVGAFVALMLSKDPGQRPEDAHAVASGLHALLAQTTPARGRAARSTRPPALTSEEQRVVSVILVAAHEGLAEDATLVASAAPPVEPVLQQVAERFGARLARLADGTLLAILAGKGAATDRAARAARCALALRECLDQARVALATGRGVVSGALPIGEAIDRAATMLRSGTESQPGQSQSAGTPDARTSAAEGAAGVSIDAVTAGLLDARFEVAQARTGLELRVERTAGDSARTLLGKPTPCVGRDRELATLEALYAECAGEPVARVALVTAPPGVGKSRLLHELLRRLRGRDDAPEVFLARGDPLGAGSPFGMLGQMLRGAAGIQDGEPIATRREKLRARVGRHVPADRALRVSEFLGEATGVPFADEASVELRAARADTRLMHDQIRDAWREFLAAESRVGPVLLVVDDLHWGDPSTVALIDWALGLLRDAPIFALALARPDVHERFADLWKERGVQETRLGELTRKPAERLVRDALGAGVPDDMVERIVARAGGNAFYLEELIRAVAEGRAGTDLPETVLAMVEARLDALDPEARRLLRAASVFGEAFWRSGVVALLGGVDRTTHVADRLADLAAREVVTRRTQSRFPGEDEYAFRHALLRDAAYATLTETDRKLGHGLAARWLVDAGETAAVVIAEHFERGRQGEDAIVWWLRAAEQALAAEDPAAAIQHADRGVQTGATAELLGRLRLVQAEANSWRGEAALVEPQARDACSFLPRGGDAWVNAMRIWAVATFRLGQTASCLSVGAALLDLWKQRDGTKALARASIRVSHLLFILDDQRLGNQLFDLAETFARALVRPDPELEGPLHEVYARRAIVKGDLEANRYHTLAAGSAYAGVGDHRGELTWQTVHAETRSMFGDYQGAEVLARSAFEAARRAGYDTSHAQLELAVALAHQGQTTEALQGLQGVIKEHAERRNARMEANARAALAYTHYLRGSFADAHREAGRALETIDELEDRDPFRKIAVWVEALMARILVASGRPTEALQHARNAARALLGSEANFQFLDAMLLAPLALAEALHATGEVAGARAAVADARACLLRVADKMRDPALRRSFLENVPENARILALAREWLGDEPPP